MNDYTTGLFKQIIKKEISDFFPGYFSLVMATGIVSIACHFLHFPFLSRLLFNLNIVFFAWLMICFTGHILFFFKNFKNNISEHSKSPGYLTLIAGTNVLGSGFVVTTQYQSLAIYLLLFSTLAWFVLIYTIFVMITIKKDKPGLEKGINGIWLLMVVSTQSIVVLTAQLAPYLPIAKEVALFFALSMFLLGSLLYIILITLIFYRLTFFELKAEEFAPPYWINMGGVSIVTLAGSLLILNAGHWDFLQSVSPFLKGFTLMFWAIGTWWIPIILILGAWRHLYRKIPLFYHHQYWGMVFPLGMYTVCTYQLSKATEIDFLMAIPSRFVYIAITAWAVAVFGMVYKMISNLKLKP